LPAALLSIGVSVAGSPAKPYRARTQACQHFEVGIDTVGADYFANPFDSRGWGETIQCRDTIVNFITFYQPALADTFYYDARMYVFPVDSNGRPQPAAISIGPTIEGLDPDPTHPNPLVFSFTPPLILPGPGQYFFDVKEAHCSGDFYLLADTTNRYPDGSAWLTGVLCDPSGVGGPSRPRPLMDLVFDIDFCDTHSTPVLRRSWGAIKQIYR
jgi:hypothetical protein